MGRERQAVEHFQEFLGWLGKQQQQGTIKSFTPVTLDPHGGDLNGFVLIEGDSNGLHKLTSDEGWLDHLTRGTLNMQGMGVIPAYTGSEMQSRMQRFLKHASKT